MNKLEYLSYDQMNGYYSEVLRGMSTAQYAPDVIIGLCRGGLDMAVKLSQWFEAPMVPLVWQTRESDFRDYEKLKETLRRWDRKNILVVDDFLDSGKTIEQIIDVADLVSVKIDVAVAVANIDVPTEATWCGRELSRRDEDQWLVFPWEDWWKTA